MASDVLQFVAFQLGTESYGVDIMMVNSIVHPDGVREIPNSPDFVEGIYNLRGEIIPVINLHKRFDIAERVFETEEEEYERGMMIIQIEGEKIGLIIDSVSRVVSVEKDKIQPPPSTVAGIRREYIQGVYNREDLYLVILEVNRIFDSFELKQLRMLGGF